MIGQAKAWLILVLAGVLTQEGNAQTLRARVIDGSSGRPLHGSTAVVLDSTGARRAAGFTDSLGVVIVRVPQAAVYSIQITRIGYSPLVRRGVSLSANQTMDLQNLEIYPFAVSLATVTTIGRSDCPNYAVDETGEAAFWWNNLRSALIAVVASEDERRLRMQVRSWERDLDTTAMQRGSRTRSSEVIGAIPFAAQRPAVLVDSGFVAPTPDGQYMYYAPDAELLVSEEFTDTHCFWIDPSARSSRVVQVRFAPVRGRDVVEIEGTIAIDRVTNALRSVNFRFVGEQVPVDHAGAQGEVHFQQLNGGRWYVSKWAIRVPKVVRAYTRTSFDGMPQAKRIVGYKETGGEVVRVTVVPPSDR